MENLEGTEERDNSDEEYRRRVEQAYNVLLDPDMRKEYDLGLIGDPTEFLKMYDSTQEFALLDASTLGAIVDEHGKRERKHSGRVRKGTLTGTSKGGAPEKGRPGAGYVAKPRQRHPSYPGEGSRPRRPTLEIPRGAAEYHHEEEETTLIDYLLILIAVVIPLGTLIWAFSLAM